MPRGVYRVLLGVPTPDPAQDDTRDNAYVFERRVTFAHGDGSSSAALDEALGRARRVGAQWRAG